MKTFLNALCIASLIISGCNNETKETTEVKEVKVFPHKLPKEKPVMPLSAAMERMYDYPAPRAQDNELYTTFKYYRAQGF